jgi:indolepyruvate ferredoxin oxidoreductase alpha subunit
MFNRGDRVLVIMQNGYTSATGAQFIPNTSGNRRDGETTSDIAATLKAMGVKWLRTIRTYNVGTMLKTLREAMSTNDKGLKVIVADGECQLARTAPQRPQIAAQLKRGERVVRTRYGVDDEVCTGDHSCIRLSGCPSLVVKAQPRPAAQRSRGTSMSTTAASAAACAARWPTPPCSARPSTKPTSSRTRHGGTGSNGASGRL